MKDMVRPLLLVTPLLVGIGSLAPFWNAAEAKRTMASGSPVTSVEPLKAQEDSKEPLFRPERPVNCEDFQGYLDDSILRWQRLKDTYLVIIVRSGTGEREHELNKLRLKYIEEYLRRHKVEYIGAEGERVKGLGRMELYVGGRLISVIPIARNVGRVCSGTTGG